ncbi:DUF4450 domain-containing protein [Pinibacter aurantiacus]|uniref:DUF4450 domain-containing protein n=1 Tax=Pinibacter aurantiacus TaxID=2851599 RepID=A0A9E2S9U2_9BACT|nr:DUF4450 domain-containing protein [Pinibacter aurantiacus]MBV4355990.1 DUF4450 domain-containing protein [Pinibacter aurantiacus]
MKHLVYGILFLVTQATVAQQSWHNKVRTVHYQPQGNDFVTENGTYRFNRALYGTNTAFRVEAGDLPEFAMYMPGMGGNLKLGLIKGDSSMWLIAAKNIKAIYRPGSMLYEVKDDLLSDAVLYITVLPLADKEGMVVKVNSSKALKDCKLVGVYGGATGKKFSRDGDIGADPESSFYLQPAYCKDNSFNIQKNAFSLLYGSGKVLTEEERYEVQHLSNTKKESDNKKNPVKSIAGIFPEEMTLIKGDALQQQSPLQLIKKESAEAPLIYGTMNISNNAAYFLLQNNDAGALPVYNTLPKVFADAEVKRKSIADRIVVNTPDPYINAVGGALSIAADGIWENPSYMHGAVAWRMRLNAWRGPYAADPLGWHDRARTHFSSYALSQVTEPLQAQVVADTALNIARQLEKMGTSMFSSGYISRNPGGDKRPHHYDMNLVFIDELLNHFNYTGDTNYVREMWPLLERHLAWEKRNFDADGDGLYDAYACIWASDALQYSGGGVTHSSAYNYRANKTAAMLSGMIGKDATPYKNEADKIWKAMQAHLWLNDKGWFAEYKDKMGQQLVHPSAGLWTVYHAIDEGVPDAFQSYQLLRYVDNEIPHIPVVAKGMETSCELLATTNWQPYDWSLNNVVLAENLHTSLAYWQGGRNEAAFRLWKSALIESMYLGISPANFQQLSFYDAMRGELYRDFADPIGMAARSLIEGLFGITPDALNGQTIIRPGFPKVWNNASIKTPDINISFARRGDVVSYSIQHTKATSILLQLQSLKDDVAYVKVNGKKAAWKVVGDAVGNAFIEIAGGRNDKHSIEIKWKGSELYQTSGNTSGQQGESFAVNFRTANAIAIHDPQQVLKDAKINGNTLNAVVRTSSGNKTFFVQLKQGIMQWWEPIDLTINEPIVLLDSTAEYKKEISFAIQNFTNDQVVSVTVNNVFSTQINLQRLATSSVITVPEKCLVYGSNKVRIAAGKFVIEKNIQNWNVSQDASKRYEKLDLSAVFNDKVTNIFKNKYESPRPNTTTLQLPYQGIGNWCYPMINPIINDAGLRGKAGSQNEITIANNIPLSTPSSPALNNIAFTSQWDNYPKSIKVPLSGKASQVYLLMAGSTNPMQTRLTNGSVVIRYTDGSADSLRLENPTNWLPIEQDFYIDGHAFYASRVRPVRVHLATGLVTNDYDNYKGIKGFSNMAIEGGAATVLDLPLNASKELASLTVTAIANDVVIGLMSATLVR